MNTKRTKILLKLIERIYGQYPNMQEPISSLIVDLCRGENVSPELSFFAFLLLF